MFLFHISVNFRSIATMEADDSAAKANASEETKENTVAANPTSSHKSKSPLDKLSKEELLTKCRNLIAIAQKAKTAKDGRL